MNIENDEKTITALIKNYPWIILHTPGDGFATDFGHCIQKSPLLIAKPSTLDELHLTIKFSQEYEIPLAIRGSAHTTGGQTLTENGLVIDMTSFNKIGEIQHESLSQETSICINSGAAWIDVFKKTLHSGFTPPTYADWLHLTAGGTVSTGGIGQSSFLHGSQADNVLAMDIMTMTGEVLHCSPQENTELFDAVRAGLGQIAIITNVYMRLLPAPKSVTIYKLLFTDLNEFISAQLQLISQSTIPIHAIQSHIVFKEQSQIEKRIMRNLSHVQLELIEKTTNNWVYVLEVTHYGKASNNIDDYVKNKLGCNEVMIVRHDCSFAEHVTRVPPIFQDGAQVKEAHHHCGVFIPADKTVEFIEDTLSKSNLHNTGGGTILIIPLNADKLKTPSLIIPASKGSIFMVAFLRILNSKWCSLSELAQLNEYSHDKAIKMGGTIYPVGTFSKFTRHTFWENHFSDQYDRRCQLKRQYDPKSLLTPGTKLTNSYRSKL